MPATPTTTQSSLTNDIALANPEADVFIVSWTPEADAIRVLPLWECSRNEAELFHLALTEATKLAEMIGCGPVETRVVDLREQPAA